MGVCKMENKTKCDLFVDGVSNMSFNSGAFRFDLVSIDTSEKDKKGKPGINKRASVVMTPQGFIQIATAMQNFLKQIEDKGIIKRTEHQGEETVEK